MRPLIPTTRIARTIGLAIVLLIAAGVAGRAGAQPRSIQFGDKVSSEVRAIYDRGLDFLAQSQQSNGTWGPSNRNGVTALALMVFLASGEDPNFGPHSLVVRRAVRSLVRAQDTRTGFIPNSMYNHGFGMLALAEAYGAVDESLLWDGDVPTAERRSIGQALEMAVRCAVTSQKKNAQGGWRYSPDSRDADTSVSGAVLVGLLAARNAGIEVPDEVIDKALAYFRSSTSENGVVAYAGGVGGFGESMNRSAIGTLVFAVGQRKDWKEYRATLKHITDRIEHDETSYPYYFRYYMAQALFQGDYEAWQQWNRLNTVRLGELQSESGSFSSSHGTDYGTSMALLSLALNYRFLPIYER